SVSSTLSNTSKEPSVCEKEALPISESSFKLLGSSEDLSSDSESHLPEEPAPLSPQQAFRRRANTLSHFPMECQEPPQPARGFPGVSQRKLMRYHSVSTETPHERKDFESKANHLGDSGGTPVKTRRHSWRQQIFLRVATPQKVCDSSSRYEEPHCGSPSLACTEDYSELGELPPRSPLEPVCEDGPFGPPPEEKKRTSCELRELWQKAILQQILLLRMEKENQKLQ
ncbi:TBC1D1 isoform 12, partial [Pongo abelii]